MILSSFVFICVLFLSTLGWAQETPDQQTQDQQESSQEQASSEESAQEVSTELTDDVTAPKAKMEKIEVTGSHIKRIDVEGPSPLLVIDQDDLVRSGYNSVSDVLRDAGVSSFGGFREVGGQQGAGTSAVDLRGLGQVRTLVLLDGQRLPSDALSGSVDMNMIPMAAVQRIEVLKDGASAIYGSDALGGVVNIITKKDFSGHEIGGSLSVTELKGGGRRDLSYTSGYNSTKFNMVNVVFFRQNERILAEDRPWSKDNFSITGSPGSYSVDNGATWKPDPSCDPSLVSNNQYCLYDFGEEKWEMPNLMQGSVMSRMTYEINDSLKAIARVAYTYKETDWVRSPAPTSNFTMAAAPAELGADAGAPVTNIRYRFRELGNRESNTKTNIGSALVGLKGLMGDTWDWESTLSFNKIDRKERRTGYALVADVQAAIDANQFNPFAPEGQRGDLSGIGYEPQQNNISENTFLEAKATGEVGSGIALAVGTQLSRELYKDAADDRTLNGEVLSLASSAGGGARNAASVFTEANFLFSQSLETSAALRYDYFDGFGSTVNPKLALRYAPMKELMFRTSAGTGFKAPQMQRLYAAQTTAQIQFVDQVYCNQSGGTTPTACDPISQPIIQGGNPNLKEETSFSFNAGTVVQPTRNHSVSVDFWYYDLNDLVEAPDFQNLTQQEADGVDITKYGATANRDPVTGQLIGRGLEASFLNIASTETQGIDFDYNGKFPTSIGDFKLRFQHSHMIYYKRESLPGSGVFDTVGGWGRPRWRNNTTLFYIPNQRNEFSVLARTIGQNQKRFASAGRHPTYTEYDFRYSVSIDSWNGKMTLGITNLLGTLPPADDSFASDPDLLYQLYDGRGRAFLMGYRQSF